MVSDPMHFLALLEQKAGALDEAAPMHGWEMPEEFAALHRLPEARMGKPGKQEYVQVLRLPETFEMQHVHGAVRQSLDLGAIGYHAVKHLVPLDPYVRAHKNAGTPDAPRDAATGPVAATKTAN